MSVPVFIHTSNMLVFMFQCEWITRWCCAAGAHVSLQTARGQHQLQRCLRYIPSPALLPWWVHAVLCGCHGDPVLQPSSCSHHVSAWSFVCLLYTNALKKKKNISGTEECPQGLPSLEKHRGIPDAASRRKYLNSVNDFLTVTLHVWQRKCQLYENNNGVSFSFSLVSP